MQAAKDLPEGKRVVVMLPDSTRNYMTKFLNDAWMVQNGFMEPVARADVPWATKLVSQLGPSEAIAVNKAATCNDVLKLLEENNFDQVPVVDENGVCGVVTVGGMTTKLGKGVAHYTDEVEKVMFRRFNEVTMSTTLGTLAAVFDKDHFALVTATQKVHGVHGTVHHNKVVCGIVTRLDLLQYISDNEEHFGLTSPRS